MTHLFNRERDSIQNKPSNHVWQEINLFQKAGCNDHADID